MLSYWEEQAYAKWYSWTPEMIDFANVLSESLASEGFAYSYVVMRHRAFGISRYQAEDVWRVVKSAPPAVV